MNGRTPPGRRAALLLGAALLAGCVSVGNGADTPAHAYLRLTDPGTAGVERRAAPLLDALLVQPQPADALADTVSIAYARAPERYGFYQFASWTERPVRQLPQLLQRRLEARGLAGAVGLVGDPLRADWLLTLRVDAIYHDAGAEPGRARLALTAELFDRRARVRVARRAVDADVPVARADAPAAAAAMSQAVAQAFDVLAPWVEAELGRALSAAAAAPASPR